MLVISKRDQFYGSSAGLANELATEFNMPVEKAKRAG